MYNRERKTIHMDIKQIGTIR